MSDTERLFVQLEARVADFERRMRQAEQRGTRTYTNLQRGSRTATRRMEADMTRSATRINTALASTATAARTVRRSLVMMGAPLAGGAGFAAITRGVRGAVSELSELGKTARDVSIDVEELQGIQRGFARETRMSTDAVNQSLERFARRVGQAAEGSGELNKVAERYGIQLRDSNGELRTQGQLLREIANVMREASSDQERLAIAQAAFGDAGRQMAQALAGGSQAIDRMIREAIEAGDVIDRDMVQRAEELDDRFEDLTRTIRTFFRRWAVEAADFVTDADRMAEAVRAMGGPFASAMDIGEFVADLTRAQSALEEVFGSMERARSILGEGLFTELMGDEATLAQAEGRLHGMERAMEFLARQADESAQAIQGTTDELLRMGETDAARYVGSISEEMRDLVDELRAGEIDADTFTERMRELEAEARDVAAELVGVDGVSFNNVIGQFSNLISAAQVALNTIATLRGEIESLGDGPAGGDPAAARHAARNDGIARGRAREQLQEFLSAEEQRAGRTREQIALERELDQVQSRAREQGIELTEEQARAQAQANLKLQEAARGGSGGSGGGGGRSGGRSAGADDFTRALDVIRQRTQLLEAEGAALVMAAESGRDYGESIEFARQRSMLMVAAQREGMEITPELEASIDRLAESYVQAAGAAREAADGMREAEARARQVGGAFEQAFTGIMSGSQSARDAIADLLQSLSRMWANAAFQSLFGGAFGSGGPLSFLVPGHAQGGYTGDGGKHEPAGIVHRGEYVFSKRRVQEIGKDRLESLHRGYAGGGMVGGSAAPAGGEAQHITIKVQANEMFDAKVTEVTDPRIRVAIEQDNRQNFNRRAQAARQDPRRRG